jgi:hypothetical protein
MVRGRRTHSKLKLRIMEVLWITKQDFVKKEITGMKDEDGVAGPAFQLRTKASKNVIQNMSERDRNDLEKARNTMSRNGFSEEYKRM